LDAFAMRTPELPTVRDPPVRARFDVTSVVVEPAESWITRSPPHRRPFAAIEKVIVPLPATDWNVTLWNSSPARFAKVSVCEDEESKITRPVPATQFVEVLPLDLDPPKVQVPVPSRNDHRGPTSLVDLQRPINIDSPRYLMLSVARCSLPS